jgi:hypothetical protein
VNKITIQNPSLHRAFENFLKGESNGSKGSKLNKKVERRRTIKKKVEDAGF